MMSISRTGSILLLGTALLCRSAGAQQDTTAWGQRFDRARTLLVEGNTPAAESIYVAALASLPASDRARVAKAHFGRAAAVQLRVSGGDTSTPIDTAVVSYERAMALDTSLRADAQYNLGLIARMRGNTAVALRRFVSAQRAMQGSARAAVQLEIAREYEGAGNIDRAEAFYRDALASDTTSREALREYFRVLAARRSADTLLKAVARWGADSSRALVIAPSLPILLTRPTNRPDSAQSRRVLRSLTTLLTTGHAGPPWFADNLRDQLRQVATTSNASEGARDILSSYSTPPSAVAAADATPQWWRRSLEDRAAWSALQRWLGDWNYAQDRLPEARRYYEAAIGNWQRAPDDPAVDRKAILPLVLIYTQTGDDTAATRAQSNIDAIYSAKSIAIVRGNAEEVRDFHMALGAYYAAKGKWKGDGAQNAEFQLSRMREATRSLVQQGKQVQDPPQLLASLAQYYQRSGSVDRADAIKTELRRDYQVRNQASRADSLIMRIEQPTPIIRTTRASTTGSKVTSVRNDAAVQRPDSSAPQRSPVGALATVSASRSKIVLRLLNAKTNAPVTAAQASFRVNDGDMTTVALEHGVATVVVPAGVGTVSVDVTARGYTRGTGVQAKRNGDTTVVRLAPAKVPPVEAVARPPGVR